MFCDKVKIFLESGSGGDGIVSFRREKYVPEGGPNGGDGGRGGSIYFIGDENINTMIDFKHKKHYKAEKGENGKSNNMTGRKGENLFLKVPLGTIIKDENNSVIGDITLNKQILLIAQGGRGGRGNAHFLTNKNRAPKLAENGEPGEIKTIDLELKLIADVGLTGLPNVGKSTFISVVSNAKSKIANYPFTTIIPKLGVVFIDKNSFVIADIPGLIEGASKGIGLGCKFLKHLERTKIILHILAPGNNSDLFNDYIKIRKELKSFNKCLNLKKEIIVINKIDLPNVNNKINTFIKKMKENNFNEEIFKISSLKKIGIKELIYEIFKNIKNIKSENISYKEYKVTKLNNIENIEIILDEENRIFKIIGKEVEKILKMSYLKSDEGIIFFHKKLVNLGVIEMLKNNGIKQGDTVSIGNMKFDFIE